MDPAVLYDAHHSFKVIVVFDQAAQAFGVGSQVIIYYLFGLLSCR
jgi:hypothetical protein